MMFKYETQRDLAVLRQLREQQCFSVINRGQLWYATLTQQELQDLKDWYYKWLDVTVTKVIPTKPLWLDNPIRPQEEVLL